MVWISLIDEKLDQKNIGRNNILFDAYFRNMAEFQHTYYVLALRCIKNAVCKFNLFFLI